VETKLETLAAMREEGSMIRARPRQTSTIRRTRRGRMTTMMKRVPINETTINRRDT
jgi:hypothetical protein